jgi:AraC-like DNA-binding protein
MLARLRHKYAAILISCTEEKYFKVDAAWEFHSLMRILSGEMKIVLQDIPQTFIAGDTFLVPRQQMSTVIKRARSGLPFSSILIRFRPEHLKDYYAKNKVKAKHALKQGVKAYCPHPLLDSFFASLIPYFDLENKLSDELTGIKINEILTILHEMDENVDCLLSDYHVTDKINLALFMEKNFMHNMPLERFAFLCGRSISTFNRDFRNLFHTTPQKWLVEKRLGLAHVKLAVEKRKPVEVFADVGFKNFSHFSFCFKKHFGYSPATFSRIKATSSLEI